KRRMWKCHQFGLLWVGPSLISAGARPGAFRIHDPGSPPNIGSAALAFVEGCCDCSDLVQSLKCLVQIFDQLAARSPNRGKSNKDIPTCMSHIRSAVT